MIINNGNQRKLEEHVRTKEKIENDSSWNKKKTIEKKT